MASILLSVELGAAGRPTLTYLIEQAMGKGTHRATNPPTTTRSKTLKPSTLPQIPEASILKTSSERDQLKLIMLRTMRPLPLKYSWTFHHENSSSSSSSFTSKHQSQRRLTTLMENINSIKSFWEVHNQFPLHLLQAKDAVHFFKRGVQPTWEDKRNVAGGAWIFKVPKAQSKELWMEILLLAVGEQFADVLLPGDDLCGISLANSAQFGHDVITIWNRDGGNRASIDGILSVVLEQVSPALGLGPSPPSIGLGSGQGVREGNGSTFEYRKHSDQPGFGQAVAAAAGLARWAQFSSSS